MTVTEWVNRRFGVALSEPALTAIKDFSLIWNVFENLVCGTNYTTITVEQRIAERDFSIEPFVDYLHHFKNRYITEGATNQRFAYLLLRDNDRSELVKGVLLGELTEVKEVLLALIVIVYRFRNNLFHGNKEIQVIDHQQGNFETANSFLMTFLNHY